MERELGQIIKTGVEMICTAIMIVMISYMVMYAYRWYAQETGNEDIKRDMYKTAEEYAIAQRSDVTGNDIINFIIKNGARYDYYFEHINHTTGDMEYQEITRAKAKALIEAGQYEKASQLWSEDYLLKNTDCLKNKQSSLFDVQVEESMGNLSYYFTLRREVTNP